MRFIAVLASIGGGCADDPATAEDAGVDSAIPDTDTPRDADAADAVDAADAADADPGTAPDFVGFWGGRGVEPGLFIEPSSIELDSAGFVYVAGHENRFQKFTRDGELTAIFGMAGAGDGEFNHPHGLAIDRARGDLIYVGDQENNRLQVFNAAGEFVRQWGDAGFTHIHDVGIDPVTGDIFVGDLELHTVRKFSPLGELLATYGELGSGPGQFDGVWGISTDSDGFVYVADTNNSRIQKLDRDGVFVAEWSGFDEIPFLKPTGVFVDARDIVHVCDSLRAEILTFSPDGTPLERWDLTSITGLEYEPEDIVVDAAGVHIYIAEVRMHRVLHLIRP